MTSYTPDLKDIKIKKIDLKKFEKLANKVKGYMAEEKKYVEDRENENNLTPRILSNS